MTQIRNRVCYQYFCQLCPEIPPENWLSTGVYGKQERRRVPGHHWPSLPCMLSPFLMSASEKSTAGPLFSEYPLQVRGNHSVLMPRGDQIKCKVLFYFLLC